MKFKPIKSLALSKKQTAAFLKLFIQGATILDISKNFKLCREKIRSSFTYWYPYIYSNRSNPKMFIRFFKEDVRGKLFTTKSSKVFKMDVKYINLINNIPMRDSGKGYLQLTYNKKNFYFHRLILNAPKNKEIDHINRDRFDNTEKNLRICDKAQNQANRPCRGYYETKRNLKKRFIVKNSYGEYKYFETANEAEIYYQKNHIKKHGNFPPYQMGTQ